MSHTDSCVLRIHDTPVNVEVEKCPLLDLSFTGMCFSTKRPLEEESTHEFRLLLRGLLEDEVIVKAQIRWVRSSTRSVWTAGAEFLTSNRGYLGPDED